MKTPPIEWGKVNDDEADSGKISDQLESPKSEKKLVRSKTLDSNSHDFYEYYLKNRNHETEVDDEEFFSKSSSTNYTNIESLKLKFGETPQHSKVNIYYCVLWVTGDMLVKIIKILKKFMNLKLF